MEKDKPTESFAYLSQSKSVQSLCVLVLQVVFVVTVSLIPVLHQTCRPASVWPADLLITGNSRGRKRNRKSKERTKLRNTFLERKRI